MVQPDFSGDHSIDKVIGIFRVILDAGVAILDDLATATKKILKKNFFLKQTIEQTDLTETLAEQAGAC